MSLEHSNLLEFDDFRVDLSERVLYRDGKPIPLTPKAFDLLAALIAGAGRIIQKDELVNTVWKDAFVEEANLSVQISNLRKALGEKPDSNRFIETIPRRGYRFIAAVHEVQEEPVAVLADLKRLNGGSDMSRAAAPAVAHTARVRSRRLRRMPTLAAVVGLAFFGVWYFAPRAPVLTSSDTILLADFENKTGDSVFDLSLQVALTAKLEESPFLKIYSQDAVRETLKMMRRPADSPVTGDVAREICARRGLKAMVAASISPLGRDYLIQLKAVDSRSGGLLALAQEQTRSKEEVIGRLGTAAINLRRKLGEELGTIKKFDAPLSQATTSSLEALKAYSMGIMESRKGRHRESIPWLRRAIEIDPNFALAHAMLATELWNTRSDPEEQIRSSQKAYDLRAGLTEREQLYVTARYYGLVLQNGQKTTEAWELYKQIYPNVATPYGSLCLNYNIEGQYEKALENGREALKLDPDQSANYVNLETALMYFNRFGEAKQLIEEALAKNFDSGIFHQYLYKIAFVHGDAALMKQQIDWARGKPQELGALDWQAYGAEFAGKLHQAEDFYRQVVELAQRNKNRVRAAQETADMAITEAVFGNCRQARGNVDKALALSRAGNALITESVTLARCGDTGRAQALYDEWRKATHLGIRVDVVESDTKSVIALFRGQPDLTIQALNLGGDDHGPNAIVHWYVRGEAYLALRSGKDAAAEFQRVLDHRGFGPMAFYWPLSHLGLARAAALTGDTTKSRKMYETFLELWKDADFDIPILKQAKAEYAKLN